VLPNQGLALLRALWIAGAGGGPMAKAQRLQLELGLNTGRRAREFGGWLEQSRANSCPALERGRLPDDVRGGTPLVMADQLFAW